MKRRLGWALLCALLVVSLGACRTATIYNVNGATFASSSSASAADMARAIKRAAAARGWNIEQARPGEMRARLELRKHVAVVDITYDAKSFSIHYVRSQNLKHEGDQIHKNYNRWVRNLENAIRREASKL